MSLLIIVHREMKWNEQNRQLMRQPNAEFNI